MAFFILTGSAGYASAPALPTLEVALTAYNAVPHQTDGDPGVTASGAVANPAVVAARSRDLARELPFGTIIAVEPREGQGNCGLDKVASKIGYRVIADTMNARITNTVDILFDKESNARTLGFCEEVTIRIVGKIDLSKPSYLPRSQAVLAAAVGASGLALK